MERLSFIDQVAHKITTSGLPPLNMQGAGVVDPNKAPFEISAMALAEHIAARLGEFPILRKKLVQDPLKLGDIRLVDDPNFDVWNHITFATLPTPGSKEALINHLAKFSAQQLDADKPLWRFEIIEGLEGGKIALAQKLSHATMDGIAAMKVLGSIFDMEQKAPSKLKNSSWQADPVPTKLALLRSAIKETAQRFGVDAPKTIYSLSKGLTKSAKKSLSERLSNEESIKKPEKESGPKVQPTSINGAISSNKRSIGYKVFQLDKLKGISKVLGCTINDLSLLMASEALSNYFEKIGEKIDFDLVLCMPISVRDPNSKSHGNALAISTINASNTIKSIAKRLEAIHKQTAQKKANLLAKKSEATESPDVTAILAPMIIDFVAMVLHKTQPWDKIPALINAVVTNVPGPPGEMYLAGMPVEYQIPMIPVFHKGALSIGVNSMGNNFSFGFHGCGKVIKQINMVYLTDGLQSAYTELEKLASIQKNKPAAKTKPAIKANPATNVKPAVKVKPTTRTKPETSAKPAAKAKQVKASPTAKKAPIVPAKPKAPRKKIPNKSGIPATPKT